MKTQIKDLVMKHLFILLALLLPLFSLAGELSGRIENDSRQTLPFVNIMLQGKGIGATSDSTGRYSIRNLPRGDYMIHVSHVGYKTWIQSIFINGDKTLDIVLEPTIIKLSEVTVSGTVVTDINTPVTFSSLDAEAIASRHHVQDIPTLLNLEPGVYVTNDGGSGFGDSRIMIRGFDEKRLQVLVNNIPVNDPETKEVSWSSWSALPEAAQAIQVQRGVGTSLYGTGALGGSINIVTLDAQPEEATDLSFTYGANDIMKGGFSLNSGLINDNASIVAKIGYLKGSGWRENSYHESLQYYLSLSQYVGTKHLLKFILHGAPQMHTLANAGLNAASYGERSQFSADSLRMNTYGQFLYGFGKTFNANVHVAASALSSTESNATSTLMDALSFKSQIGAAAGSQTSGFILAGERASLNNNVSHRPQLEAHHRWYINEKSKLTSTAYLVRGLDYSDDVYPAWYIPRDTSGAYNYDVIKSRDYFGANEVFQYRYYSDFYQGGFLTSFSSKFRTHEYALGIEARYWSARHAGEVLNTFGLTTIGVPIGSIVHDLGKSDLFYDFTTTKPQATFFGHALWHFGKLQLMTNFQLSAMSFRVLERVPSNNNYPVHLGSSAALSHSGGLWEGTATWDDDDNPTTVEVPVLYHLWDYSKQFAYITPRLGLSYTLSPALMLYTNLSIGVKEPEIKHFYGYGAPQDDLELEKTQDVEVGLNFDSQTSKRPLSLTATFYSINFAGKLMQITLPEKANTPGYDYAGHTYVPVGDARYSGFEFSGLVGLPWGFNYQVSGSKSVNTWGEPNGSAGAQKLYANDAVAGTDFEDQNGNGIWDEGGSEQANHQDFVGKYGARYDVGMPQLMINNTLGFSRRHFTLNLSMRYFSDLYVLENNAEILTGPGADDLFFTEDDIYSATLPSAFISDLQFSGMGNIRGTDLSLSLHIINLLDTEYWQRGDAFGVFPGAARSWMLGLSLKL